MARQSEVSVEKNKSWFLNNASYEENVHNIDSYKAIRNVINREISGVKKLLDIGNGGVFGYDTSLVKQVIALDLFLDQINTNKYAKNISFQQGSALQIPAPDQSYDAVFMDMLIHHLTGLSAEESLENVQTCIKECYRVLAPGGRLLIVESCVPKWFYSFEKKAYQIAARSLRKFMAHPMTLQYPMALLREEISNYFKTEKVELIPKGRFILQFGLKFPSALSPAQPYCFIAQKR